MAKSRPSAPTVAPRRVLHRGPFQPVLEAALAAEVRRVREQDPMMPILVLCATPLLCQHLKRRLVDLLAGAKARGAMFEFGHAGIRFLTVNDLAATLATAAMAEEGRSPLPEGAARVLWRRAVAEMAPGGFFESIRHAHGFPGAVKQTIRELKEAGLTPNVIAARARGDTRLDRKLRELTRLWKRVEDASAAAGFHDDLDLLRAAAGLANEDPPLLRGVAAFLYGFHRLPHTHRRLVSGFLQRPVAAAFLPWADDAGGEGEADAAGTGARSAFRFVEPTYDFLQGTLELLPDDPAPVAPKPMPPFEVIAAPGDAREAIEVARAVATVAGGPLRETGVLMRTPSVLATRLDLALEDAGIPRYLPGEIPLGHLSAARALRLLLEARREDQPRAAILDLFTTAPLRFDELLGKELARGAAPGVWDAFTREWGIVSGAEEWNQRIAAGIAELERSVERDRDGGYEGARPGAAERVLRARALARMVRALQDALAGIPEEGRWSELSAGLLRAWTALFDFGDAAEPVVLAIEAIAKLDALGGGTEKALARGTLAEMTELLDDALASPRAPDDTFEGAGVFVADLARARGLPFRTVIVPGMVEGLFPRVPQPDPLLSDSERRHLNRALEAAEAEGAFGAEDGVVDEIPDDHGADGPIPLRAANADEERFFFRMAIDAAAERVIFTLPRIDSETGRERVPSWLLLSLVERATKAPAALTVPEFAAAPMVAWLPLDPAPAERAVALTGLERDLFDLRAALGDAAAFGAKEMTPADLVRVARLLARGPFARSVIAAERLRWGERRFTVQDGWLEPPAGNDEWREALVAVAFRPGAEVSATRLETYATCPYRYFLRYGLGLAAIEEPERQLTMNPLDRGDLIHRALERFWREERARHEVPVPEEELPAAQDRLEAITRELLDAFAETGLTGPRVLWDQARAEIVQDLRETLRLTVLGDGDWRPGEAIELGFGSTLPGGVAPPEIGPVAAPGGDGPGGVSFRGRIDRVDLFHDGAKGRVVDYKSGSASLSFKAKRDEEAPVFHGGAALQLPVYVLAARQRFPEVKDWAAVYDYCTRRGNFQRAELPIDDGVLARLGDLVRRLSDDAAAGRFPFIAGDHCRWCDYQDVCGPAHDIAFEAKAGCDEFAPFRERPELFK